MPFFENIKKLFGFGDEYDDEYGEDATVTMRSPVDNSPSKTDVDIKNTDEEEIISPVADNVPVEKIFEHVVQVFNKSLPEFLATSVDAEQQKKYLFDTLDNSIKEYLAGVSETVAENTRRQWKDERNKIQQKLADLSEKERKSEEKITEAKNLQLSAERQKRAFAERVHDLENQIAKLEADREQLQLENRSLINKVKVNSVQEGDYAAMREEIAELKSQLEFAKKAAEVNENVLVQTNDEELQKEIENLKAKVEELSADKQTMEELIFNYKTKTEVADQMVVDLNNIAATAKQSLADKEKECDEQKAKIETILAENNSQSEKLKNSESAVTELQNKLTLANEELQSLQAELSEATENLSMLNEIQTMVEKFEEVKKDKDTKISELSKTNKKLADEIDSLKATLSQNMMDNANTISVLQQEITQLKNKSIEEEDIVDSDNEKDNKSDNDEQTLKISAIDETLDNTDWLSPFPTEDEIKANDIVSDTDSTFGYKPPVKKNNPPEDSGQMSLW